MSDLAILAIHLIATVAKLLIPGGVPTAHSAVVSGVTNSDGSDAHRLDLSSQSRCC